MKIALGADHAGFEAKERLRERLRATGHEVVDVGTRSTESCDYPDFALKVARAVADRTAERGMLVCGTGIGMAMAANKVAGIRAAVCTDEFTTQMSRRHNDANIFCAGARVLPAERIAFLAELFLKTEFEGGRHLRRVQKITEAEGRS
ncbi:MAG: ribose 5-phosphate isomerase B [Planctomycetes bacterium]|nr:ribose 5-phosphate isomerase B [Planctomycetota bacterium]